MNQGPPLRYDPQRLRSTTILPSLTANLCIENATLLYSKPRRENADPRISATMRFRKRKAIPDDQICQRTEPNEMWRIMRRSLPNRPVTRRKQ
ncbi:hypothetical protein IAQ61_010551, partial [Plenodomus lingam]|uniref:Predicted protein n=1 Tax=Leptosphaeria maculans (strain JN3 / isolate v23.1.3 / race Av1-4-5-6-7-8) TaxID=985895 RepID=E5A4C3_LEPMJ